MARPLRSRTTTAAAAGLALAGLAATLTGCAPASARAGQPAPTVTVTVTAPAGGPTATPSAHPGSATASPTRPKSELPITDETTFTFDRAVSADQPFSVGPMKALWIKLPDAQAQASSVKSLVITPRNLSGFCMVDAAIEWSDATKRITGADAVEALAKTAGASMDARGNTISQPVECIANWGDQAVPGQSWAPGSMIIRFPMADYPKVPVAEVEIQQKKLGELAIVAATLH